MDGADDATTQRLEERLAERFPDVAPETVAAIVRETYHQFEHQPIQQFTALLVENLARKQLSQAHRKVDLEDSGHDPDPTIEPGAPADAGPPAAADAAPDP